ncbi:sugar ABC transporter permease [Paenibacillus sp.]|uniref:carbohydrate ABC transporter permease n=1 Tax=Paenibacillus sp. TaxID=58172 RepID=UPI002D31FFF1|nr:sugar ABC transporter permease [Paenibacillus sp.]HZG85807.1 sugar ABC transporter permease [Paenibacillus sp.]
MNRSLRPSAWGFVLYLLPGLLIYSFVVLLPIVDAFRYSLYAWTGGPRMRFIALENYGRLLHDELFWYSFWNNLVIIAIALIGQVGFAIVFSLLLHSRSTKFKGLHRTMSYFPSTLSAIVVAMLWSLLYNYNHGLINAILRSIGLDRWALPWLDMPGPILLTATAPLIWQAIGGYAIIILAGYTSINKEVLEMAEIDGASGIKRAMHITLPLLKNTLMVCVVLCIAANMRGFDHFYALTGGGPGNSSLVVALYAYNTSFTRFNYGYGSAISIGIMILSLALIVGSRILLLGNWRKKKEA